MVATDYRGDIGSTMFSMIPTDYIDIRVSYITKATSHSHRYAKH